MKQYARESFILSLKNFEGDKKNVAFKIVFKIKKRPWIKK